MPRNFSALVAQIIIVGLLILCRTGYSQPFDFIESLRAGASDKLYRTFGAEKCSYDENYIEANSTQMLSMDLFQDTRKFFTGDDKTKVSESLYFDWAAKEQLNINSCVNKSVSLLLAKPALQKIIFEDIKTKLPMFRDLTQSILAIEREIRALDDAKTGQALTGDLPSLESSVDAKNFEFQRQELLAQREMLQTSIWGGEHPLMRAWISKMMLENREPKFSELLDHLRSYGDDNQLQTQKLLTQARFSGQRPVFIKLENESKKGLVYNPSLWTKFSGISQDESENLDLHEVMCRLQGKYGKGDDYLDNSILLMNLSTGFMATLLMRIPQAYLRGLALAERTHQLTANAAQILFYSALGTEGVQIARSIEHDCLSHRPNVLYSSNESCQIGDSELMESFEVANLRETNCALAVAFNAVPAVTAMLSYRELKNYLARYEYPKYPHRFGRESGDVRVGDELFKVERRKFLRGRSPLRGPVGIVEKVSIPAIVNLPAAIRIVKVKNARNRDLLYSEYAEDIGVGEWVRASREIQLDRSTGAIDANFPGGRQLFERIAQAKAGHAHMAFIDVGSLRVVNMTFKEGKAAGDDYLKAVANAIYEAPSGQGKLTLARVGGDEFAIIIDETEGVKVREILLEIQQRVRERGGAAHRVFRNEKKQLAETFDGSPEARDKLQEFSRIQQPDISIGATQIGYKDNLLSLAERSEKLAKAMKIETAVNFARDPAKYGSRKTPKQRAYPQFLAKVRDPAQSPSWKKGAGRGAPTGLDQLRPLEMYPIELVKRFKSYSIIRYRDEKGRDFYQLEEYYTNPATNRRLVTSVEIPTRGQTGMLDGSHERSQKLVLEHFRSGSENYLVMPKIGNLRELNYFAEGMQVGDRAMQVAAEIIQDNLRANDLSFKLGGADFLCSLNKISREKVDHIIRRIESEFKRDPRIAEILAREIKSLKDEQTRLLALGESNEAHLLDKKILDIEHFDFKFKFETVSSKDISESATFKDIIDSFDAAFAAHADPH